MLHVILDSDTRLQAGRLVQWLGQGHSDPLIPDTLIVADMGSGIWLQQQIAKATGISANIRVQLPGRYIWTSVQAALDGAQEQAPFDRSSARWAIHQILDAEHTQTSGRPELRPVLLAWEKAGPRDKVVMATELAAQYERYLSYRRHWVGQWAAGRLPAQSAARARPDPGFSLDTAERHEPWQAWLWRELLQVIGGFSEEHPFDALATRVKSGEPLAAEPGRVALFGQLNLSGEQLFVLATLAGARPSIWFAHDPSQGFWEKHLSPAEAARMVARAPEEAWLYADKPAVLGEWGRQCRDSLAQIRSLEQDQLAVVNDDDLRDREPVEATTNLHRLQKAVFELDDEVWVEAEPLETDESLEVHSTHGVARQVDVACDRVLAALDEMPGIKPDEIAIFCTDLDAAAPLIRSAFAHPEVNVPIQVSGASYRVSATVAALEGFFALVAGPAHINAVLDWFEGPAQRAGLGLHTDAFQTLREFLGAAGAHRDDAALNTQPDNLHGLRNGIDRLLLGALLGEYDPSVSSPAGIEPVGAISVAQVEGLGRILRLLDLIGAWRGADGELRPQHEWIRLAQRFADEWLSVPGQATSADMLLVRDALGELADALGRLDGGLDMPLAFPAFAEALSLHLQQGTAAARASGAVTVAPVGSLREVSFRVCVLLGLDEGIFPLRRPRSEHDLIAFVPAFGDADSVAVSRGWFLRLLLNTQDRLVCTYHGHNMRDNAVLNPARPLAELLDYLGRFEWADHTALVQEHPLQPYSPRRFLPDLPQPSYARQWFNAARALAQGEATTPLGALATTTKSTLESEASEAVFWRSDEIVRTLADPAKAYLQHGVGLAMNYRERELDDIEPFGLDDFRPWEVFDWSCVVMQWLARGHSIGQVGERLALSPLMPAGAGLDPVVRHFCSEARRISVLAVAALNRYGIDDDSAQAVLGGGFEQSFERLAVPMPGGNHLVTGELGLLLAESGDGVLHWLAPVRRRSMDEVLRCWVSHLLACSRVPDEIPVTTVCLVPGAKAAEAQLPIIFNRQSVQVHDALSVSSLAAWPHLLGAAMQARTKPAHWFPRSSAAWLDKAEPGEPFDVPEDSPRAWAAAETAYFGTAFKGAGTPECARPAVAALWRDEIPELDCVLRESLPLYAPIWWAIQQ